MWRMFFDLGTDRGLIPGLLGVAVGLLRWDAEYLFEDADAFGELGGTSLPFRSDW